MHPIIPAFRPSMAMGPKRPASPTPARFGRADGTTDFQGLKARLERRQINLPNANLDPAKGDVSFSAHEYLKALAEVRAAETRPGLAPGLLRALRTGGRRLLGMNEEAVSYEAVLRQLGAGLSSSHSEPYHIEVMREDARLYSLVNRIITPLVQDGLLLPSGFSRELYSPSGPTGVFLHAGYALTSKGRQYLAAVAA